MLNNLFIIMFVMMAAALTTGETSNAINKLDERLTVIETNIAQSLSLIHI